MQIEDEARHVDLVCRLFEAALEPGRWSSLSADIAHAFGADSCSLLVLPPSADRIGASELARTEFCTDFCRNAGRGHAIGCVVRLPAAELGLLSVHRPSATSPFGPADKQSLTMLVPYFERALRLHRQQRDVGLVGPCGVAALDSLDTAVFVVDARLRVLHVNAAAQALAQGDTPLHLQDGRLVQDGAASLSRLVHAVLETAPGAQEQQSLCLERRGGHPLLLTVSPYLPADGLPWLQPCAIVMARDPATHRLSRCVLQQLFGLTSAEAGVAQALAHGEALEDIAATLEISVHTVKTHLKKLFLKTGTRRQAELVALLHDTPAVLSPV